MRQSLKRMPGPDKPGLVLRLWGRFRESFFRSGLSPRELALTLALGAVIGILPIVWGTTLLCVAAALVLRLNQARILAVNYLLYPLQLALFVPFCRLGERFFPGNAGLLCKEGGSSLYSLLIHGGRANIKAIGAWLVIAPLLVPVVYGLSFLLFNCKLRRRSAV